ncbi:hypothetical protein CC86DRAFT_408377 [Ophiobolus disseminans]|uniref:Cupredoxin n=1 Tax=Ophiobolus disseminans TaxID=1469910 RepID=A0A6A6ZVA2_9PLEO|nr:hypothetical protein CC86DRAFT_408377 [Ophiobolus disseminans]
MASRSSLWLRVFLVSLLLVSTLCLAQDVETNAREKDPTPSLSGSSSLTSSALAQTHTIQVGLADHKFKPDVTNAAVGDIVEFRFYPANHSVVRAAFGMPCIPYEMTGSQKTGFFSGFNAVNKVVDDPPKYSIKINDTSPIFFYCSAPGSCITYGMVGAINPNASTPIAEQQKGAKGSAYMLNPGEPFPPEAPLPSNVPGFTAPAPSTSAKKHGLSAGAIAGIAIAAISVVVLGALLFFFWGRTKSLTDEVERKQSSVVRRTDSDAGMLQSAAPQPTMYQHYSSPTASHLHSVSPQPLHGYNQSVSSSHTYNNPASSYFSPPPTQDQKYTSPILSTHPAFSFPHPSSPNPTYTSPIDQASPITHELPHDSSFAPQTHRQRSFSPHCLDAKLGPASPAPPYGFHVNSSSGPLEMEGTPVRKASVGGDKAEREGVRERGARWEEVKGEEGRMF